MASHVRYNKSVRMGNGVPIPTTRNPAPGTTIRRAKTLTRPERSIAPVPLINPRSKGVPSLPSAQAAEPATDWWDPWVVFSNVVTFWAPAFLLESIGGLKQASMRQAWREKVALCVIALMLGAFVGFATMGLQKVFCPQQSATNANAFSQIGSITETLGVQGFLFNVSSSKPFGGVDFYTLAQHPGIDITPNFTRSASQFSACRGLPYRIAQDTPCSTTTPCPLPPLNATSTLTQLSIQNLTLVAGYDWDNVASTPNYIVIDGAVLNMNPYMALHPTAVPGDDVDAALRTILVYESQGGGKDGTRMFYGRPDLASAVPCLKQRYYAGNIDKITPGCFVSQLILYAGLIVILGLVLVRFVMACIFNWFISSKLAGPPGAYELSRSAISPAVMPEGANVSVDNRNGVAPWAGPAGTKRLAKPAGGKYARSFNTNSSATLTNDAASPIMNLAQIGPELFCVCLVTCYSEGEDSMKGTLDSLSATNYSDARKLLFVVADGMITGAGEKRSTPDICVSLLDADPRFGNPMPMSYFAVGSGAKAENRAMIYAGHYTSAGRRTPMVIIVKCGTEKEALHDKKPGNRGKRDSQLILMNFFSRVTYNDRMSPLDFDLFRKVHILMGVTPDYFETCLMVDADTKVHADSMKYLVNCMQHDPLVMGVCGETRISNKRQSWVTAIQVYEYFIAHHMAKAFESVFGGVTCLPGCFSMYRLKARKQSLDDWVPLIIQPEVIQEYSQNEVHTLHQKNLLLLGEDRFLTTLLLRTFPNRKMMFLPQAKCRTVAPDTFNVLLSQRRRWINSTVHNLMELVRVRDLCGTFCFSMQFVVFMDLIGTVVLPVAICLTYTLIVNMALNPPQTFEEAIPLMLLVAVIGLPAVLILITTRKVVYVFWMLVYLVALPVWNFVLPVYSFWHFDDFSWGETRKVEGEGKGEGHGGGGGKVAISVPLRRWEDWERSRLRKIKREERRRKDLERMNQDYYANTNELAPGGRPTAQFEADAASLASSDDDQWGGQVGGYNENAAHYPPPPVALTEVQRDTLMESKTVEANELEAMLEGGFDDESAESNSRRQSMMRYQLSERMVPQPSNGYAQLTRGTIPDHVDSPISPYVPVNASSTGVDDWQSHAKKRSGGRGYRASDERQDFGSMGPLGGGQARF